MTKVVIYSNTNLESFYEQTMQYLYEKYHSHPTMLDYGPLSEEEAARISYYDGMGRETVRHAMRSQHGSKCSNGMVSTPNGDIPIGKAVF